MDRVPAAESSVRSLHLIEATQLYRVYGRPVPTPLSASKSEKRFHDSPDAECIPVEGRPAAARIQDLCERVNRGLRMVSLDGQRRIYTLRQRESRAWSSRTMTQSPLKSGFADSIQADSYPPVSTITGAIKSALEQASGGAK